VSTISGRPVLFARAGRPFGVAVHDRIFVGHGEHASLKWRRVDVIAA
jgi:hypothetical protein